MRSCLFLAAALSLLLHGAVPVEARSRDDVRAQGVLRVAVYEDYAPFSYREDGGAKGIDVAIAGHIAGALGVKLELVFITSGETLDSDLRLNFLRGDLAGSPLSDVMMHVPHDKQFEARQEFYFFSAPYFEEQLAIASDRGTVPEFTNLRTIAGKPVAVEVDSASDLLLLMVDGGLHRNDLRHYRTFAETMAGFLRREAPFIAGVRSEIEGGLYAAKRPMAGIVLATLTEAGPIRHSWPIGIAVKDDARDLAQEIADILMELRKRGELERIFASFGVSYRNVSER